MSAFPPPSSEPARDPAAEPQGMVVCEVTGRTVPEDETVVFQGRRVSAEGKQILADRLNAGESMPGELEDASRLARFGGAVLDNLMLGVVAFFIGILAGVAGAVAEDPGVAVRVNAAAGVLGGLLVFVYYGLMHAHNGQTIGKMAARSRVVTTEGGPLSTRTAWVRSAVYALPNAVAQLPAVVLGLALGGVLLSGILAVAAGVFGLVNTLLIFRESRRCLHDDLAGTRVVTTRG